MNGLKRIFFIFIILFCCVQVGSAQKFTVQVEVNNISSGQGEILLALFNQADGFPDLSAKAFRVKEVPATPGKIRVKFDHVPPGMYAISVFHDTSSDKKLNTNFLGIPVEDYGFSTNIRLKTRAPYFEEAAFEVKRNEVLSISLK